MFLDNKYCQWYFSIIDNAKERDNISIKESHHIIPRCLGGSNKKDNLVNLTPKEHYIVHLLLTKMVESKNRSKMLFAFKCMSMNKTGHRVNSKLFEHLRIEASKLVGMNNKGKVAWNKGLTKEENPKLASARLGIKTGLPGANLGIELTEETKLKISATRKLRECGVGNKNSMFGRSAPKENNLKWYTNGTEDIYVTEGTQPLGFLRGRSSVKGNKNPLKNKETAMKLSKTRTTLQRNYLEDGSFTMVGRV